MELKVLFFSVFLCNFVYILNAKSKYLLTKSWQLSNLNKSINIQVSIPGGIYSDLMSAKIIDDIYYRFNDEEYRWIANESWIYSLQFQVEKKQLEKQNAQLIFEGLDTFAIIYLNNIQIGITKNMFVRYNFQVKQHLLIGENILQVKFKSPIAESNRLNENYAKNYTIPPNCVPKEYNGECHVNLIRKMQASFAWDWGPAFPSVGIWKPVYLQFYNSAKIQSVSVNLTELDNVWEIKTRTYFECDLAKKNQMLKGVLTVQITTDLNVVSSFTTIEKDINTEIYQDVIINIPKNHVKLWWPNGFGSQPLYKVRVKFSADDFNEQSIKSIYIGFRTVELIQNPVNNGGLTFFFKINSVPIFAKGSNWIPANILPEKQESNVRFLLQSAKDVHMNMLRVWGGGVYESEMFYQLADQFGILIWQDFMFACSMYPSDEEFLRNVRDEVKQQVRRLQHHASIILWAGNNENEAALRGNWYRTDSNFSLYKNDYIKLYVDTIRETCMLNDLANKSFVVSSPSNGLKSDEEGYVAKNPYDTLFGDIHYYNYIMDGWNQNIYPRTRFSSEYGFQSLPSYETFLSATSKIFAEEDLREGSKFLTKRQHHLFGYEQMKMLIDKHLQLHESLHFKNFIYFTQISQAMSYKAQTEYYRQWRNRIDENGNGFTMGALYWQLNDVWQAPSWSTIDFGNRWKMAHYFAKNFFAPVLVSSNLSPSRFLTIYAINDLMHALYNTTLSISVYKWDTFVPVFLETNRINIILSGHATIVRQFFIDNYLIKANCGTTQDAKNNCFLHLSLEDSSGQRLSPDNFIFPTYLKNAIGLNITSLPLEIVELQPNIKFNVTIKSNKIALFVWLETGNILGQFSENGFIMVNETKTIRFESLQKISLSNLKQQISVTALLRQK